MSPENKLPLLIFAGSCPDYSHKDGKFTFENLNSGIPLLTIKHLAKDMSLFMNIAKHKKVFYAISIADCEAEPYFVDKFCAGNRDLFLERCGDSCLATQSYIKSEYPNQPLICTSFFKLFGEERFCFLESEYKKLLHSQYFSDIKFKKRVDNDIQSRASLYKNTYGVYLEKLDNIKLNEFLVDRTIRTMAQYLTIAECLRQMARDGIYFPIIISHPTVNLGLYNETDKFLLSDQKSIERFTIPTFVFNDRIY